MFPDYDDADMFDAMMYLSRVAQDVQSGRKQTITAASFLGQVEILKIVKPSLAMQMMSAMDAALDAYRYQLAKALPARG